MNNDIIANSIQIKAIKDYVSKRFAIYNIASYQFSVKETTTLTYGHKLSQRIEPRYLGIFQHALGNCDLRVEVWRRNKDDISNFCTVGLNYEHNNGGSNGVDINCEIIVGIDGQISEKY